MDISSLLSPSDELSPANPGPSPRSRPSRNGSSSESPVTSSAATRASSNRLPSRQPSDGDVEATMSDVVMGEAADVDADPVEPLSEDDNQRIQTLLKTVQEHPYQYTSHVEYIALRRRAFLTATGDRKALLEELRKARETMIEIFPMVENMWLEWIEDENSESNSFEERLRVMELCTRAVTDQVSSVRLFKAYGDFVEAQSVYASTAKKGEAMSEEELNEFKEFFPHETVVDTYRQGAEATINDIAGSYALWNKYRDLVMQDLIADTSRDNIELVYNMYRDRLSVPHAGIEDTWAAFSQFVTQYDNANYEQTMIAFNKIYSAAYAKYSAREVYELPLKRTIEANPTPSVEEWEIWDSYLTWETTQPRKKLDETLSLALYERCLLRFGEQAKVWEDYVFFLLEKCTNSLPKVISVLQRATRHCPWSGTLWAQQIVALEKGFKPFEEVSEVKHKATRTELLDSAGDEEVLKVNVAWCGFLKRRAFEHDAAEDDLDMAEMGINEAVTESQNGKFKDPDYRLQRIQVNFYTEARRLDQARSIWKALSKSKSSSYDFWLRYYYWELVNGTKELAGNVVKSALTIKDLDWPERLLDVWKTHVEDFGDIMDVEKMMVRYRRFALDIAQRRERERQEHELQAAYAQEENAAEAAAQEPVQSEEPGSRKVSSKRPRSDAGDTTEPTSKKAKSTADAEDKAPAVAVALVNQPPPTMQQLVKRDRENLTIIVKNLPPNFPEVKVRQFFRECGEINSLKIIEENGSSTATVEFDSKDSVLAAQIKDHKIIDGYEIEIQIGTGSTLYVTNFPPTADESYIRDLFEDCGEIVDIRFPSLKYNSHRRFCYVQFSCAEAAQKATSLDGKQLGEKERLVAKISAPNQKKNRSGPTFEGREVYIRNIDFKATENDVRQIFERFGKIEKIRLPPGPRKGTHKGFGFVIYETKEEADASLESNGVDLKGRILDISIAQVDPKKAPKPGKTLLVQDSAPGRQNGTNTSTEDAGSPQPPSFDQIKQKTLGIMNLADTVNDTRLRKLFEPFGPLRKISLRPDHQGAIVEYENVADAGKATLALEGTELDGLKMEIGELADLMQRKPVAKVTKGFTKGSSLPMVPASVRNPYMARGGGGGGGGGRGRGQKRRGGLGFTGAISRKNNGA